MKDNTYLVSGKTPFYALERKVDEKGKQITYLGSDGEVLEVKPYAKSETIVNGRQSLLSMFIGSSLNALGLHGLPIPGFRVEELGEITRRYDEDGKMVDSVVEDSIHVLRRMKDGQTVWRTEGQGGDGSGNKGVWVKKGLLNIRL